jgi:DNA-binding CsgD family transcriptional regulator
MTPAIQSFERTTYPRLSLTYLAESRKVSSFDSDTAYSSDLATLATALSAAIVIDSQTRILYQNPPLLSKCLNSTETQIFNNLGKLESKDRYVMAQIKTALLSMKNGDIRIVRGKEVNVALNLRKIHLAGASLFFVRDCQNYSLTEQELSSFGNIFTLTPTERKVLATICEGHSLDLIAPKLNCAMSTIRSHVRNILAKTNCEDVRRLVLRVHNMLK